MAMRSPAIPIADGSATVAMVETSEAMPAKASDNAVFIASVMNVAAAGYGNCMVFTPFPYGLY